MSKRLSNERKKELKQDSTAKNKANQTRRNLVRDYLMKKSWKISYLYSMFVYEEKEKTFNF